MQFCEITSNTKLTDISDIVGERNVDYVLNANGLHRSVNIGQQMLSRDNSGSTDAQTKMRILDTVVSDSDVYEKVALGSERDWVSFQRYGTFHNYIRIPSELRVIPSATTLGNGEPVSDRLYSKCSDSLKRDGFVDPIIFTEYSVIAPGAHGMSSIYKASNPFEWFKLPWGKISLYSSLSNRSVDFPVYPLEYSDGYSANYEQMPNMLYQYEPWQVYKDSGPRQNTFTFDMHRDMWSGDHRDGLANELVRFCEANCFPRYQGSTVRVPKVTLYLNGNNLITGILNSCKVDWSGPLGLDGFYLNLKLTLDIVQVSPEPLNYDTVAHKGLMS